MSNPVHILIVEDAVADAELAQHEIRKVVEDCTFQRVDSQKEFINALETFQPDLIISDYSMPRFDGKKALNLALKHAPLTPLIIWTGSLSEDVAVECMKAGANNYIIKDNIKRLGPAVVHALGERQLLLERRQAEIRYRALFDQSHDAIFILDFNGNLVLTNRRAAEMLGYSSEELIGLTVKDISAEPEQSDGVVKRLMNGEIVPHYERLFRKKDGTAIPVEVNVELVHDDQGKPLHIQSIVRDITDRKQAEQKVREQDRHFRALIENSLDNISLLAADSTLLWENPSVKRTLGYQQDEHVGRNVFELIHPDDQGLVRLQFQELLKTPAAHQNGTFRLLHHDGTWRWTEAIATNLLEEPGVGAVVINYRDITERKQAEIEIQQRTDDLALLNAINEAVIRGEKLDVIVDLLTSELKRIFSSVGSTIYMLDPGGQTLTMQRYNISSAIIRKIEVLIGGAIPLVRIPVKENGFFHKVLLSSRGIITSDSHEVQQWMEEFIDTDFLPAAARGVMRKLIPQIYKVLNIKSTIIVPLISDGKTIGLMDVSSPNIFTESDLERIERIGRQLTGAFQRQQADTRIRESERFLQSIQDALSAHIAILDETGIIVQVNTAWRKFGEQNGFEHRLHGIGLNYLEICDSATGPQSEEASLVAKAIRNVIAGYTKEALFEYSCHSPNERRWFTLQITKFEDVERAWIVLAHENITERKEAELHSAYQAHLLSNVRDAVLSFDTDFVLVSWNQAAEDMYGWTEEEVVGRLVYEVLVTEFMGTTQAQALEELRSTGQFQTVVIHTRKDGSRLFVDARASALRDPEGKLIYVAVNRDITERKEAEQNLQRSETRFRGLFENTPIAIWEEDFSELKAHLDSLKQQGISDFRAYFLANPDVLVACARMIKVTDVNTAAIRMYEADSKENLIEETIRTLTEGEQKHNLEDFTAIAEGENSCSWEGSDETMTGKPLEISLTWTVAPGYESDYSKVIVTTVDITQRKQAEHEKNERLKEMTCLYAVRREMSRNLSFDELCEQIIKHLTVAMQFPEITAPVIEITGRRYTSEKYQESLSHSLSADILVSGSPYGRLLVYYTEQKPFIIPEEQNLINSIADDIRLWLEGKQAEEKLRSSEERFRQLAENIQEVFWMTDAVTGEELYISPASQSVWGRPVEEIQYNPSAFLESVLPEDRQIVQQTLDKQRTGSPTEMEYRIIRADGTVRWVWDRAFPIFDDSGKVVRLTGIAADITERKNADERVRESEERYRGLFNNLVIGFALHEIILDDNGDPIDYVFLEINPMFEELTGIDSANAIGHRVSEVLPGIENDRFIQIYGKVALTGEPIHVEEYSSALGRYFEINAYSPKQGQFAVTFSDITERKRAEDALRESQVKFAGVVNTAMDAVIGVDQEQRIILFNPAAEQMFGCPASEAVGRPLERFIPDRYRIAHKQHILNFGQTGTTSRNMGHLTTLNGLRYDGVEFPLEASISHIEVGDQHLYTVILRDITERKQAEEALQQSEERYRQLLNLAPVGVAVHIKGMLVFANTTGAQIFGAASSTKLIGMPIMDFVHPDERQDVMQNLQRMLNGEQGLYPREERFVKLDGTTIVVEVIATNITYMDEPAVQIIVQDITKRKQAERDIKRHFDELEALYENGLAVSRLLEPREIGERIIKTFNRYLSWHHVTIRLLKNGSDELDLVVYSLPRSDNSKTVNVEQRFTNHITRVGQGLSGWIAQTGQPLRTSNVHDYPQYVAVYKNIKSGLYMPLKIGTRVTGVISVESERFDAFTAQDERLLATLANQAAVAFENARLYQSVQQELNERRRIEKALRTSETHYRDLADSITDIFFELDQEMRYTHWNKASEALTGVPEKDAIGKKAEDIFGDSDEQTRISRIYEGVLKTQRSRAFEAVFYLNNEKHSFEINVYPSTRGVSVVAKDVTERKQSELLQQKRFELMEFSAHNTLDDLMRKTMDEICELTSSQVGFFHFMEEDQAAISTQTWSSMALELFNVPIEAGMHKSGDQAGAWADAVRQRRSVIQNDVESLPHRKGIPDGHLPILREMVIPIIRNERIMAVMGVANKLQDYTHHDLDIASRLADYAWDITERKRMQADLAEERNQLAQRVDERTAELIKANTNLARALRVKDEFLANMSHELRTPLNAILGLSESLAEQIAGPLNEKQSKYINTIGESGHHLLSLINDILDLAKIEAGQITLDVNKVDVQSVCQASLRMVKQLAQKKNQNVLFNADASIGLIWADERRLKQMLVNLLSNAVKFTTENGTLGLDVHGFPDENRVEFSVWDNGIGISEEDLERLFSPFVQLDSGLARESTGTGLGLALVSQMARLHGGSVTVSSEPGKGSRFTILLPWEPALARDTVDRLRTTGQLRIPNDDNSHKKKILLIEDTTDVIMMIRDYLETSGFNVATARDGMEGIEQAKIFLPDLILMDVQMPRMDGIEATKKLRAEAQFKYIPIIALTALAMPNDRERCIAAGMDEYISKPVNLRTLVKVIQKSLLKGEEKDRPL